MVISVAGSSTGAVFVTATSTVVSTLGVTGAVSSAVIFFVVTASQVVTTVFLESDESCLQLCEQVAVCAETVETAELSNSAIENV
jgi:hypothetical protein